MTAPSPVPMRERLRTDYHWTPRQREVLTLIARGKTNTEIGDALGISLDGAKWHVSEILSKLQAESREEAADYWRRYNGVAPRFSRVFRGLTGAVGAKWVAGAAAVVVAGAAAAVAIAIALNQSSDEPRTGDHDAPAAVVTAAPDSQQPSPGAANPAPGPSLPSSALPAADFSVTDGSLPSGLVVYYYGGNVPIEGPPPDLRRAYRDSQGQLHVKKIYERIPGDGQPYWLALDATTGRLAVALCLEGYCGGYANGEQGSRNRLVTSTNGGITWADRGSLPLDSSLAGFIDEGLLVITPEAGGDVIDHRTPRRIWLFDSGREVARYTPGANLPVILRDGRVATPDGQGGYAVNGSVIQRAPSLQGRADLPAIRGAVNLSFATSGEDTPDGLTHWIAIVDSAGTPLRSVRSRGANFGPVQALGDDVVFVNGFFAGAPGGIGRAGILNMETGHYVRLADLVGAGDREAYGVGAVAGPFAEVSAGGDCLNVRESPTTSAKSLVCYADGVLLRDLGETRDADGATWLKVATVDGREGWASLEFLTR